MKRMYYHDIQPCGWPSLKKGAALAMLRLGAIYTNHGWARLDRGGQYCRLRPPYRLQGKPTHKRPTSRRTTGGRLRPLRRVRP